MALDRWGRIINYMRISITDRCNLKCVYCTPAGGARKLPKEELLSFEEIERIVRAGAMIGVEKVRITGGEPLMRRDIDELIRMIRAIDGIHEITLTTNGTKLAEWAERLAKAGLDRVNVSLDSMRGDRYRAITGGDFHPKEILRGIEIAEEVGLTPVKLNVVLMKGVNEDEVEDFARLTLESPLHVRFIELMPFAIAGSDHTIRFLSEKEVMGKLSHMDLEPVASRSSTSGPARYYRAKGALGLIGFISPISHPFCSRCNRIRLSSDGKLRLCLASDEMIDLKSAVRGGMGLVDLAMIMLEAIRNKPIGYRIKPGDAHIRAMTHIGG
ncbi:GTP 3',8-cyclase MoaA [Candidatus Poribacteria bacterium]|nr:GTP 3',8-cyclase MoaA [Candidatus Poribacteria bacterium]